MSIWPRTPNPRSRPSFRRCSRPSSPRRSTIPAGCSRSSGTGSGWRRSSTATACGCGPAASRTPSRYFGPFLDPPTWLAARQAVVDGEVIALDDKGEPDFALLQARIKGRGVAAEPNPFVYEVFDLLHLDGRSLLDEPLEERRRLLASVLRTDPRVRLSEHIEADGIAFFEAARTRGLEGIMAKDRRSVVRAGQAHRSLAEGQDPPGAGARRRRLGDGHRHRGRPRRAARRRVRGRRAPLRRQGRRRVHRRPARRAARRACAAGGRGVTVLAAGPARGRPRRPVAQTTSSSSAPSSPAGRATASSARPPTRASSSRRTRTRSSASARRRSDPVGSDAWDAWSSPSS